jgi:hypothetical protein
LLTLNSSLATPFIVYLNVTLAIPFNLEYKINSKGGTPSTSVTPTTAVESATAVTSHQLGCQPQQEQQLEEGCQQQYQNRREATNSKDISRTPGTPTAVNARQQQDRQQQQRPQKIRDACNRKPPATCRDASNSKGSQ